MHRSVRDLCVLLVILACGVPAAAQAAEDKPAPTPEETTLTEVGQVAPDFTVATLDGGEFHLGAQEGKVVLINWFATWCPPCQQEMPHLQTDVWERFADRGLVMISVARQETAKEVAPFVEKYGAGWTFGLDPDRTAYARYAEAFIPRNTVVGPDGKIIFQSNGFEMPEFEAMIEVIHAALGGK